MKLEVLEKAITMHESIKNIDNIMDFLSKNQRCFLELRAPYDGHSPSMGFTSEIQQFLLYEALQDYQARLIDELEKL